MNKLKLAKKLIFIFLLAILTAGILGCGKQPESIINQEPTTQETTTTEATSTEELDTSGWQTYRNEEWGFELKYPKNYTQENNYYIWHSNEDGISFAGPFGNWGVNKYQETIFSIESYSLEQKQKIINNFGITLSAKTSELNDTILAKKIIKAEVYKDWWIEKGNYIYIIGTTFISPDIAVKSKEYHENREEYKNILKTLKIK